MPRLSPEAVSQTHANCARLSEGDHGRGGGLDAIVENILDRDGGLELRRDRTRGEQVEHEEAAQRKLIEVVVELYRRPPRLHAGERSIGYLQRGLVARHLRRARSGRQRRVGEEIAGARRPAVPPHARVLELRAARPAAYEILA